MCIRDRPTTDTLVDRAVVATNPTLDKSTTALPTTEILPNAVVATNPTLDNSTTALLTTINEAMAVVNFNGAKSV